MKVIVLAGGQGTRLWPLSNTRKAKQFLQIGSSLSLFEKTLKRFADYDVYVSTDREKEEIVRRYVGDKIFVEPAMRNTAPAIAYIMRELRKKDDFDPQEPILFVPSDHAISPEEKLFEGIEYALTLFPCDELVLFGVKPRHAETGYGYIKSDDGNVVSFCEKPALERAEEYVRDERYLWNTGMYMCTYWAFHRLAKMHSPALTAYLEGGEFEEMPVNSIDVELTEKCCDNKVIALDLFWSDLGSWESVYQFLEKDQNENVLIGDVVSIQTKGSYISSVKKVVTIGIEDLIVVETDDALLISKRGDSQQVKSIDE